MAKAVVFKEELDNMMSKCYQCEHLDNDCEGAIFKGFALMNGVSKPVPEECECFEIIDVEEEDN